MLRKRHALCLLFVTVACSSDPEPGPAAGTERGPCYGNNTCNEGLSCLSNVCVVVPDAGSTPLDAGHRPDGGFAPDGGQPDAQPRDATLDASPDASLDAAVPDAIGPDAQPEDGSPLDAASDSGVDTGFADASTDASVADTAVGRDAAGHCSSSGDCIPGEVCGDLHVTKTTIETRCRPPNPSPPAVSIGDSCTQDSDCVDNVCLDGISNECSVVCSNGIQDCPAGFDCVGYTYTPGPVQIMLCNRSCGNDSECPGGNVCSTTTFEHGGVWRLSQVCNVPVGSNQLGESCTDGSDCRSGLCLTSSRFVGCTGPGGCNADETCQCTNGSPPPCPGGAGAACISSACSSICVSSSDCQSSYPQNQLTDCSTPITYTLPDQTQAQVFACSKP